ncbi:Subtilisin-like serine endopeptidase family protein [Perilla frutescens var. frutescens]|nr:Subtilisin-like serine endopeptidase family protein [Perilla frutescens var. frutescens]
MEGVVSVFPNTKIGLHTTRSWEFMGLPENVERAQTESDIIVGVIDSGIWPESPSFSNKGLGPPPTKWKGICQSSYNFTCNNKIIGARYYGSGRDLNPAVDMLSLRDTVGHGTHTASIVGGGVVPGANLYGLAAGSARGGVPSARIAVYKVCFSSGCSDMDMLAAFDDAIADGVDIISISAGGDYPRAYYDDPIAIGSFHAMQNGILTSSSAGNFALPKTIYNVAPWAISVAATTIDRKFLTKVRLGNNITYESKPTATIFKSDQVNEALAPFVASFSSRGPNPITRQLLKPDLSAPGVDILAAWSEATTVTGKLRDTRVVPYNILSGTSMACPHATAAAAYVKSFNPTWSPAAIKSALMTTATPMSKTKDGDAEFAYGSGHINPVKAKSPGLVYDIEEADYIKFLCGEGYKEYELKHITGKNISCAGNITVNDLNYPSFAVVDVPSKADGVVFHRTVTNVGSPSSTYKAVVMAEAGLSIRVEPDTLSFASLGEKRSFVVTVKTTFRNGVVSGSLVYIVYMGDRPKGEFSATAQHMNLLHATLGSTRAEDSWLYSYKRSFNGFVAKLTEEEKTKIASLEGVVSVFPSMKKQLHTTRSWDFMGFPVNVQRTQTESDIIVGMLDSGIWPESQSFDDEGLGPPPRKWKGSCQSSSNFTCNNKIIGAKYYHSEGPITPPSFPSPRDYGGHGTHTSSIVAGCLVSGANLYGFAAGTARGGVPSARIAVYKICWHGGCSDADILAAFDDAIADGVDIISISVGGLSPADYFNDSIAIGAFHSMKSGILTSNAAGNSGPDPKSIINFSPWSLSVAASTIDRKYLTKVQLSNNKTYEGVSVNTFTLEHDNYPLVYGGDVPNTAGGFNSSLSRYCLQDSLNPSLANGTIVLCDGLSDGEPVVAVGAAGAIMQEDRLRDVALSFPLPASYLGSVDGGEVYDYINTTRNPSATIFKSDEVNETLAPFVASFSSRGPNPITMDILKPDLSAPGVDILAAWSEANTVSGYPEDTRVVPYNIVSGTSMSCPHASAAAAYVKSFNPTWSPAAIKSALMTTAFSMSTNTNTDAEFAYGSGHINPLKAKSPGLVYDMKEADYVRFLCGQGYSTKNLQVITGDNSTCAAANNGTSVYDLNYPSFSVSGVYGSSVSVVFHRTVTNVGSSSSTYTAVVLAPPRMSIQVQPSTLSFTFMGETQNFVVSVNATIESAVMSGYLVWDDGTYQVRSPVVTHST